MNADQIRALIDETFSSLETRFASRTFVLYALHAIHSLVDASFGDFMTLAQQALENQQVTPAAIEKLVADLFTYLETNLQPRHSWMMTLALHLVESLILAALKQSLGLTLFRITKGDNSAAPKFSFSNTAASPAVAV